MKYITHSPPPPPPPCTPLSVPMQVQLTNGSTGRGAHKARSPPTKQSNAAIRAVPVPFHPPFSLSPLPLLSLPVRNNTHTLMSTNALRLFPPSRCSRRCKTLVLHRGAELVWFSLKKWRIGDTLLLRYRTWNYFTWTIRLLRTCLASVSGAGRSAQSGETLCVLHPVLPLPPVLALKPPKTAQHTAPVLPPFAPHFHNHL